MATLIPIDDPDDDRVSDFVRLKDPDLRRRRRESGGVDGNFFIAEGALVIRELLRSPYPVRSLLLTPLRWEGLRDALDPLDVVVHLAAQSVVDAVSGFPLHRGALASADRLPLRPPAEVCAGARTVVVTEGVNDHENVGALFRNAAAFGVGAVLLDPTSCDPLYRRSVRVSMGHVLHVPFTTIPAGVAGVEVLRDLGFEVLALTPAVDAVDVREIAAAPPRRRAVLVGAEGPGLTAAAQDAADRRVRIAMAEGVDSLNVSTAAAIVLHALSPGG